ncbi:MAG: ribonuclease P protein component [Deltaproteobacteria bacterium RIFOXYD12_FULL_50_9]|nr:MAG: ribonuclease P protein component [Deltaproteobacteria bacterium RIFOXYD12_FULL_50_9]
MKSFALPKSRLLRKPWQYQDVYRRGRRLSGRNFSLIYVPGAEEGSRLGISIHGVKKATRRNRIKRIIRECFRLHGREWLPVVDVVITVRQGFSVDSSSEFCQAANTLVKILYQAAPGY